MIKVIFENKDIVALNKPAGLLTHPDRSKKGGKSLVEWLVEHYPEVKKVGDAPAERPGIVHRLDRDTSGVLIVARSQAAFAYLKKLFQTGGVRKTYAALVYGELTGRGVINKPIGLRPGTTKRSVTSKNMKMVKEAVTEYQAQEIFEYSAGGKTNFCTFLKVMPKTGRTHQIRVHLASISHPIVGDALYGPKKQALAAPRQFLHAAAIELVLPDKSKVKIEAELPEDLRHIIDGLKKIR